MLTACLGRELDLTRLRAALDDSRWVSVVGPPGCGKSLLVRHALHDLDPVWIDARDRRGHDEVVAACLDALGADPAPGESVASALASALGDDALLVVDGVDLDTRQLGGTMQAVIEATSGPRVVVTALTTAERPGERVVRLGPLSVPRAGQPLAGPALDLLLQRVVHAGGRPLDVTAHEADLRRLLEATGGLPLLLEQVAAQIATVGLVNVAPPDSLSTAVRASYELLDEASRTCWRRIAHLPCPVSIEVVAAITGTDRGRAGAVVADLVRRSLLESLPDGRVDLLSPLRPHALLLADSTCDADAVRQGILDWADRVAPHHVNQGASDAPWLADLPVMRAAVLEACADPATRDRGYALANRIYSSLYTSMRARDAVEILEAALTSGDGPADIGAQVARRAGIAASEVRGTYAGLWLLDRADEHAARAPDPDEQLAKNASIRAEMHLDAGDLARAEQEARRAIDLDGPSGSIIRQATRTLADVLVSRGEFGPAADLARRVLTGTEANDEPWIGFSARTLLARIAAEQGRLTEAASAARTVISDARAAAEDRVALLAEILLRELDPDHEPAAVDREALPWSVRVPVLVQDARDALVTGDLPRAVGRAADAVVLADSSRLGRDSVEARLLLGHGLFRQGDLDQAAATFLAAMEQAATGPLPLRVADALDALAQVVDRQGGDEAGRLAAAATALRAARRAVARTWPGTRAVRPVGHPPRNWVRDAHLTESGRREAAALVSPTASHSPGPLDVLTAAERQVADRVADGLTNRQIAEELFVSPRTVDAHLSHVYRKLGINTRARLAAMVVGQR